MFREGKRAMEEDGRDREGEKERTSGWNGRWRGQGEREGSARKRGGRA